MKKYTDVKLINYENQEVVLSMSLGARETMSFQSIYRELTNTKETLTQALAKLNDGDVDVILALASACLHSKHKNGVTSKQPIGFDKFDDEFPLFQNIDALMAGFEIVMGDLNVESDKNDSVGK